MRDVPCRIGGNQLVPGRAETEVMSWLTAVGASVVSPNGCLCENTPIDMFYTRFLFSSFFIFKVLFLRIQCCSVQGTEDWTHPIHPPLFFFLYHFVGLLWGGMFFCKCCCSYVVIWCFSAKKMLKFTHWRGWNNVGEMCAEMYCGCVLWCRIESDVLFFIF